MPKPKHFLGFCEIVPREISLIKTKVIRAKNIKWLKLNGYLLIYLQKPAF